MAVPNGRQISLRYRIESKQRTFTVMISLGSLQKQYSTCIGKKYAVARFSFLVNKHLAKKLKRKCVYVSHVLNMLNPRSIHYFILLWPA